MSGKVPAASIIGMAFSLAVSVGLPIAAFIFWKIRAKAKTASAFIGAGAFILFALVLEQIFHTVVFSVTGTAITGNLWLYAVYGGLCAGLFEETGRMLAMKLCMKKFLDTPNGVMYGIGHGGIEAILVVGLAMVNNIANSIVINSGGMEAHLALLDDAARAQAMQIINALLDTPSYGFFLGGVERISAFFLQICLSVLVYQSVCGKKPAFWFLALGIHFLVDALAVILSQAISTVLLEALLFGMVALICYVTALRVKKTRG